MSESAATIEALIFAHGEPLSLQRICEIMSCSEETAKENLQILSEKYNDESSGIELVAVAGKYQFRTKAAFAPFVRMLKESKGKRLSAAALETLSVIAYRQPVTRHEIEKIRGVDPTPTLKTLLERELITLVGYKESVGQPGLYGTTEKFLHLFGLNSLSELPELRELKAIESDPGEQEIIIAGEEEEDAPSEIPV